MWGRGRSRVQEAWVSWAGHEAQREQDWPPAVCLRLAPCPPFPVAIATELSIQGCMLQAGCSLLGGAQAIGPLDVSENCSSLSGESHLGKEAFPCLSLVQYDPVGHGTLRWGI